MFDGSESLHSMVVELGARDRGRPPATLGRAIHAQVLAWFNSGNPEVAKAIHTRSISPIALSGLLGNRRPSGVKASDYFSFRISLLDDRLVAPLLAGIEQWGSKPLVLGKFPFVLRQVYAVPGSHRLVKVVDYRAIAQSYVGDAISSESPIPQDISLTFLSPTSFKQQQHVQPFPLPELVFNSLLRRWNAFAPEDLHFPKLEWQGWTSAYDLKTHALNLKGRAQIGSQGWATYRFPDPEQARIASILAQFAFFSGVGRKTAMGMGQVSDIRGQISDIR